jgi:phosphoglycerate dehydrogenase-like enzyme
MNILVSWDMLDANDVELIRDRTGAAVLQAESKEQLGELISQADVIFGFVHPSLLARAERCHWLQIPYAGVERVVSVPWGNPEMVLTNGSGIFGPNIAEHVMGMILAFNRGLHVARDYQHSRTWQWAKPYSFRELTESCVGILGFGDIGRHVAKRLAGFDCQVIAFRTVPRGDEGYASEVYALSELDQHLPRLDYLVCALPHTPKTAGFLHKERLRRLPKHAVVINVGRGSLIPEQDLVEVLKAGELAGAGLDVLPQEPLPAESELWSLPNVIITPHNSGLTPFFKARALEIFLENWASFVETGSPVRNVVEREKGY